MASPGRNSSMTKEQLKTALVGFGIPLPPGSAKKEEFQRLYNERVLPMQSTSEFSSDDEPESEHLNGSATPVLDSSAAYDSMNTIRELSDEDLFAACVEAFGRDNVGPVMASTRSVYQNKLYNYCCAVKSATTSPSHSRQVNVNVAGSSRPITLSPFAAGDLNGSNGFSDSDDDVETASRASKSSRTSGSSSVTGLINGTAGRTGTVQTRSRGKRSQTSSQESDVTSPVPEQTVRGRGAQARRAEIPVEIVPAVTRRGVQGRQRNMVGENAEDVIRPASAPDSFPHTFTVVSGRNLAEAMSVRAEVSATGETLGFTRYTERVSALRTTPTPQMDKKEDGGQEQPISRFVKILGMLVLLIAICMALFFFQDSAVTFFNNKGGEELDELDEYLKSLQDSNNNV